MTVMRKERWQFLLELSLGKCYSVQYDDDDNDDGVRFEELCGAFSPWPSQEVGDQPNLPTQHTVILPSFTRLRNTVLF